MAEFLNFITALAFFMAFFLLLSKAIITFFRLANFLFYGSKGFNSLC